MFWESQWLQSVNGLRQEISDLTSMLLCTSTESQKLHNMSDHDWVTTKVSQSEITENIETA